MAEYSREQRNKLSRAIANNSISNINTKKIVDNRRNFIQLQKGDVYSGVVKIQPASGSLKIHIDVGDKWGTVNEWYDIPSSLKLNIGDKVKLTEETPNKYEVELVEIALPVPQQPVEILPPDLSSEIDTTKVTVNFKGIRYKEHADTFDDLGDKTIEVYLKEYVNKQKYAVLKSAFNLDKTGYVYSIPIGEGLSLKGRLYCQILFEYVQSANTIYIFHAHGKGKQG